jgi:hypothetical protein
MVIQVRWSMHIYKKLFPYLATINGASKQKIHNFYDNPVGHVQALETLGKLGDVAGNVRPDIG